MSTPPLTGSDLVNTSSLVFLKPTNFNGGLLALERAGAKPSALMCTRGLLPTLSPFNYGPLEPESALAVG